MYDFLPAPFVTYICIPKHMINVARFIGYVEYLLVYPTVLFTHSMNQVLVYIFYSQFKKLKKNFRRALGDRGEFHGDLSTFRRRHH